MSKHTPGPWVTHPRDGIPAVGIDVGDGGDLLPIVDIVHGRTKAEAKRNRRLIAAAPELLEALRAMVSAWEQGVNYSDVRNEIGNARAAIAKATGAQQ